MASRKIEDCVPFLQTKYAELQARAAAKGIKFVLTCTARAAIEQRALYAQGRETLDVINHLRENASLPAIGESENHKVTWTLDSKHIINDKRTQSEAFDIGILDSSGKHISWDLKADIATDGIPDYQELADIGREIGLGVGADFKNPDYPHYEVKTI
jgi:peptidoglycan LD-endopeptidase CwlK